MAKDKATKQELTARVTERLGDAVKPGVVEEVVQATFDEIAALLKEGHGVGVRGFGTFEVTERKARLGRNPRRPARAVEIPARRAVRFRAGKGLRIGEDA